ncbi:MarR family transcriptional regulator [Ensifer sp. T173]|jgi:DNA-binding MarR family transcriptional regulator|uniref:MarR family transcriptional regulator n=2 Tax=Sinorhizobium/Ensifer group TaxID=227292 RepID=A0AAW4FN93_9HYPH|nr:MULTISPECIES: MarR family transcriptional regulator [Ensifer]MBD9488407.1 MarR family transcriptional regulator [Ensifer sp. ENS11]KQW58465.1 MarR family transcriptional regulator [Ensifer sp. Root1252]KQW62424.1 MarR family transcriptional regulator [Ensifer sp. Root127]KQY78440.1 MarR family transcriptional regulator [Ensifer sp. Root142]KRC67301.1 MarR family transcriptional regulator [Ensifer sp. Root231]
MIEVNSSSPAPDGLVRAIGGAVMRWQDATQAYDEAVGERLQLNAAERRCLAFLHAGPRPAGAIAEETGLTPAAVTALIDRMEARGLLQRTRSAEDRRKVMVENTDAVEMLTAPYYRPIAEEGAGFLATFSAEEQAVLLRFLEGATALQQKHLAALRFSP